MSEITLKNGDISAYGFACGYIQIKDVGPVVETVNILTGKLTGFEGPRFQVRLYAEGIYHIKVWDEKLIFGPEAWESYETLSEARKAFKRAVKFYSNVPEDYRLIDRYAYYYENGKYEEFEWA